MNFEIESSDADWERDERMFNAINFLETDVVKLLKENNLSDFTLREAYEDHKKYFGVDFPIVIVLYAALETNSSRAACDLIEPLKSIMRQEMQHQNEEEKEMTELLIAGMERAKPELLKRKKRIV